MAKYNRRYIYLFFALCALIAFSFFWKYKEGFDDNKINYLDGVDVIYWINLDRSKVRRQKMEKMFHDDVFKGIPNQRIVAYDGQVSTNTIFSKLSILTKKKATDTEYACLLSHLEAIRTFHESENIIGLIFEDDTTLEFQKYWTKSVKDILKNAPSNWEVLLLGYIYKDKTNKFYNWETTTDDYDNATNYYSGISYLINKSGSSKIMKTYKNGKYTLDEHTEHVADSHIFQLTNSYVYKYPMFIYTTLNNSTIHADHIPFHDESKEKIIENYKLIREMGISKTVAGH